MIQRALELCADLPSVSVQSMGRRPGLQHARNDDVHLSCEVSRSSPTRNDVAAKAIISPQFGRGGARISCSLRGSPSAWTTHADVWGCSAKGVKGPCAGWLARFMTQGTIA